MGANFQNHVATAMLIPVGLLWFVIYPVVSIYGLLFILVGTLDKIENYPILFLESSTLNAASLGILLFFGASLALPSLSKFRDMASIFMVCTLVFNLNPTLSCIGAITFALLWHPIAIHLTSKKYQE